MIEEEKQKLKECLDREKQYSRELEERLVELDELEEAKEDWKKVVELLVGYKRTLARLHASDPYGETVDKILEKYDVQESDIPKNQLELSPEYKETKYESPNWAASTWKI